MKRERKSERAQGLVEFALILPLFLILVFSVIDFGWGLRAYVTATNSAREGARSGIVGETESKMRQKAKNTSAGMLTDGNIDIKYYPKDSTSCSGTTTDKRTPGVVVCVRVNYNYSYITPLGSMLSTFTGGTLPNPLPMKAVAKMRME